MAWNYKRITLEGMLEYMDANVSDKDKPEIKKWFKNVAFDEAGKYQHLVAKQAFVEKFMPEILPKKKPPKQNKSERLKTW